MSRKPVPARSGDRSRAELTFDRPQLMPQLFGEFDQNLLLLENRLGVYITARGNKVGLEGAAESVAAARENAALSGMADAPIRWIVDDAQKFVAREVRRARRYDGIILDPPKYGRGPDGEVWRLEEHLAPLVADCRRLLDADSRFLFLTVYAVRMSALVQARLRRSAPDD